MIETEKRKYNVRRIEKENDSIVGALDMFKWKWSWYIIYFLYQNDVCRFNQFMKEIPITKRMLVVTLDHLVNQGTAKIT